MRRETRGVANRQIVEEAAGWFVDFRVGDADASARQRFDEWLRSSPVHIRAYMEIARTYTELPALKSAAQIDTDALIAAAREDADVISINTSPPASTLRSAAPYPQIPGAPLSKLSHPLRLAACIVVLALLGTVSTWIWLKARPIYATDIGENRSITLADGSTVDLNARSRIQVAFSKTQRSVQLIEGQALFVVAKDAVRPFVVQTGTAVVRAVGTEFDINKSSRGTKVTVVEGQVAIAEELTIDPLSPPRPTYVSAGQQVTVTSRRVSEPTQADSAAATAWTVHRLIFEETPLADVVEEFNRYHERQITIDSSELDDFHVSGVYASTDPASLLRFLRAQPGVQVIETDDSVHITVNR